MKKIVLFLYSIFAFLNVFAQSPENISYQAVIRDRNNFLVSNTQVGLKVSILQESSIGNIVYTETISSTTNANGLVSVEIGSGDGFSDINWANGPYFIKTEIDPNGGTNYTITGISQLLSVPYALHAKTAESISGGVIETDPLWKLSPSFNISSSNISNWNSSFGWGNHATAGYLTSFTETDPVWTSTSSNYYTKTNIQTSGQS